MGFLSNIFHHNANTTQPAANTEAPKAGPPPAAEAPPKAHAGFFSKIEDGFETYGKDVAKFAKDHPAKFALDTVLTVGALASLAIPGAGEAAVGADAALVTGDLAAEAGVDALGTAAGDVVADGGEAAAEAGSEAGTPAAESKAAAGAPGEAGDAGAGQTAAEGTKTGTAATTAGEGDAGGGGAIQSALKKAHTFMESTSGKVLEGSAVTGGYAADISGTKTGEEVGTALGVVGVVAGIGNLAGGLLEAGGKVSTEVGSTYLGKAGNDLMARLRGTGDVDAATAKGATTTATTGVEAAEEAGASIGLIARGVTGTAIDGVNIGKGSAGVAKERAEEAKEEQEAAQERQRETSGADGASAGGEAQGPTEG